MEHTSQETGRAGGNFVIINRGTNNPVAMSTNTAELPVRNHRPDGCGPLLPGTQRRQTVTLGGLYSFRVTSFIQGCPQNYIAAPSTQYSFCVPGPFPLGGVPLILPDSLQLGLALFTVGTYDTKYLVMVMQSRSFIYKWIAWHSLVLCAWLIVH